LSAAKPIDGRGFIAMGIGPAGLTPPYEVLLGETVSCVPFDDTRRRRTRIIT